MGNPIQEDRLRQEVVRVHGANLLFFNKLTPRPYRVWLWHAQRGERPGSKPSAWTRLSIVGLLLLCLIPSAAQGAIQFRAATKHVSETVPLTAGKPAGTAEGDLLVAFAVHDSDPACPCDPPSGQGWTAFSLPGTESEFTTRAWYKQVDASDTPRTDYTFTFAGPDNSAILYIAAFYEDSGAGNWTLEDGTGWAFDASSKTISNGGVTAVNNSLFVVAYGNDDNESVSTAPSGPTNISADVAAGIGLAAYYETVDAIDGSVSYPITWSGSPEEVSAVAGIFSWSGILSISGTVFEDVDFAGTATDWDNGVTDVGLQNVDVELYDAGDDSFIATAATGAGGVYTFPNLSDGTYKVRVRSATIGDDPGGPDETAPAAGFDSCVGGGTCPAPLAEMTWGNTSAQIGGQDETVDDTATGDDAGPGDTWATVTVSGSNVTGANFGFSYELIVNTTDDTVGLARSQQGCFRQFLKNANAITGALKSYFAIPQTDPGYTASPEHFTIQADSPTASFTWIKNPVDLDGTTQPEHVDTPVIELKGAAGSLANGLQLQSGATASSVRGFAINDFGVFGLNIAANDVTVAGNFIGTDVTGTIDAGNGNHGILMNGNDSTIGGLVDADRNVISANGNSGIELNSGSRATIQGNYIGTDKDGANPLGNDVRGIGVRQQTTIGGAAPEERNVISSNGGPGIDVSGSGGATVILGNYIGTDKDGLGDLGNTGPGVQISTGWVTVGGTANGEDNLIANNATGITITGVGVGNTIVRNRIYANDGIGIDLVDDGVTINDAGDVDTGPNGTLNFPVLDTATIEGANFELTGWARPGALIELFIADSEATNFGEGQTYSITLTESGSGAGGEDPHTDWDSATGSYGPGLVNGLSQGQDTTNRFRFVFPTPAGISAGTELTATARDGDGNTSEFSGNVAAAAGTIGPLPSLSISGIVFEDVGFIGTPSGYQVSDHLLGGVEVELYDATDTYLESVVTSAAGEFSFFSPTDGNYKVRVRSETIGDLDTPPASGFAPATIVLPLPEMTWGDGTPMVGGQSALVDDTDTTDDAGPGDTWVPVTVSGASVSGVDFGFTYDLVVNTADDGASNTVRSDQGSLRQFLKNANSVDGTNTSYFAIPVSDPGYSASPLGFTIQAAAAFPTIGASLILDGTTQTEHVDAPIIEIDGASAGASVFGLYLSAQGANSTIRGLVIHSFTSYGILVQASDITIVGNYIGTDLAGTAPLGNGNDGIIVVANNCAIGGVVDADRNVISGNAGDGIRVSFGTGTTIRGNYIGVDKDGGSAGLGNTLGGIRLYYATSVGGTVTEARNVISGNGGDGVVIYGTASSGTTLENNYIGTDVNGTADLGNGGSGVWIVDGSTSNVIGGTGALQPNIIAFNTGDGIWIDGAGSDDNRISANSVFENDELGIDIAPDGVGTGSGANQDKSAPTIASITPAAGDFDVVVTVGSGETMELFRAVNAAAPVVTADPTGSGEGFLFLGTCVDGGACSGPHIVDGTDADPAAGSIQVTLESSGADGGDALSATATDATGNTSEFAANAILPSLSAISGTVFEDVDFAGTATAYDGGTTDVLVDSVDVELYDADNADAFVASTATGRTANGAFSFSGLADGNYKVRVRAATLGDTDSAPAGGLNGTVPATWPYPLPELTWANGALLYGGQSPTDDDADTADDAGPGDNYVSISVSGADVTGVDFGFAYNLIVNTTDDGLADNARSDQGSLRQFLKNANAIGWAGGTTASSSRFRIPNTDPGYDGTGNGEYTIQPVAALPTIADSTIVDGTTHPDFLTPPIIELDGSLAGGGVNGISITAGSSVIRGLVINRFLGSGISISVNGGNKIEFNYIGLDVAGALDRGNTADGIVISANDNTIGGPDPEDRNIISGNGDEGIDVDAGISGNVVIGNYIGTNVSGTGAVANGLSGWAGGVLFDGGSNRLGGTAPGEGNLISGNSPYGVIVANGSGNEVIGNRIGTDKDGLNPIPNTGAGIIVANTASGTTIGGTTSNSANTIAYNGSDGVEFATDAGSDNPVIGNSIYANTGLGIDLSANGVTSNDGDDADSGPNDLRNFPEITSATESGGTVSVDFDLDLGAPLVGDYRIEFFTNPDGIDGTNGEGQLLASAITVSHGGTGVESFSHSFAGTSTDTLTATTTDSLLAGGYGSTSEFSEWYPVGPARSITGTVFEDVDFAGTALAYDGGATDALVDSVDVELYDADNADAFVASTATGRTANGTFSFTGLADGNYKVRVRAATLGDTDSAPAGGLNGTVPLTWPYPLPEMTWSNGSALYGGQSPTADDTDTADDAGPGDNYVSISVSGADVTGVDFGFAYNLIVNTQDDGNANNTKSDQGSLRQFIKNTNAIGAAGSTTANASQFRIPASDPGYDLGTGVSTITPASAFPAIVDGGATVDGATQTVNVADANGLGPEVELDGAGVSGNGLDLASANNIINELIIGGFDQGISAGIRIPILVATDNTITGCYIGTNHDGTAANANATGVLVTGDGNSNTIGGSNVSDRNIISGNTFQGVQITGAGSTSNTVAGNYIGTDRAGTAAVPNGSIGVGIWGSANANTIGGTGANEGNIIAFNGSDGIWVGSPASDANEIRANSIFGNGGLGIDLDPDGVGAGGGANNDKATPTFTSLISNGSDFDVVATVTSGDIIDFFRVNNVAAPVVGPDPTSSGEGFLYLGSCVDNGACTGPHIVGGADADPALGTVEVTLQSSGLIAGDWVSTTATDGSQNTSEFSANMQTPAGFTISGLVFEDTDFAGTATTYDGGINDALIDSADVELYTSGDVYIRSTATGRSAAGAFSFTDLADGDYKVRVRSATIGDADSAPSDGLLGTVPATWPYPLPEMVWGDGSSLLGGQSAGTDDTGTGDDAGPGDTYVSVTVSGADETGVDFGFSFDVITNTQDDSNADTARSIQGSLRQFIKNSNAIAATRTSWFQIPNTDPNYNGGGAGEYTITPIADLPNVVETAVLNGATHPDFVDRPLIEISGSDPGTVNDGLHVTAGGTTIRGFVINGFPESGIELNTNGGNTVVGNYLGTNVGGTAAVPNGGEGVLVDQVSGNTIGGTSNLDRNVLSGNTWRGILIQDPGATGNHVVGNYIGTNAAGTAAVPNQIGVYIWDISGNYIGGTAADEGNVISGNTVSGVYAWGTNVTATHIEGNTIGLNEAQSGPIPNGSGIFIGNGPDNVIGGTAANAPNVIASNNDQGIVISGLTATGNSIVSNSIYGNGKLGIDLGLDEVTANDPNDDDDGANELLNFPEVTSAFETTGTIDVDFDLDLKAGWYRVEFFTNASGTDTTGFGEGETRVDTTIINHLGTGSESFMTSFGGSDGDVITASCTECEDGAVCIDFGSTSEFSLAYTVGPRYSISGQVFEDADFAGGASAYDGGVSDALIDSVDVELYDADDSDAFVSTTTTGRSATGEFSFTGLDDGNYKVRVRSASIGDTDSAPAGGLNGTVPGDWPYPLPEMTWGRGSPVYGGQSAAGDDTDTADDAGPGDTYISVSVSGADVTGVDFGFAYNLVVNAEDDGLADNARSDQGSLRQFLKNANAIGAAGGTTANSSEFRMQAATNQSDGGDDWWRIIAAAELPALEDAATVLDASTQRINSASDSNSRGPEVELFGNGIGADGLIVDDVANAEIRELAINSFGQVGITIKGASVSAARIYGNYIGTDAIGENPLANIGRGVSVVDGGNHEIGGIFAGEGNLISGNGEQGIRISSSDDNNVRGNKIGTDRTASLPIPNVNTGLGIQGTADNTTVGGAAGAARNIISANLTEGIKISGTATNIFIYGNTIGTGILGTELGLGNDAGIEVNSTAGSPGVIVGGYLSGEGNLIAENTDVGVDVKSPDTQVLGNVIRDNGREGVISTAADVLIAANLSANSGRDGIKLNTGSTNNEVYQNTVHGSAQDGIEVVGTGALVSNNIITGSTGYGINVNGGSMTESYNNITDAVTNPPNASGQSNVALDVTDQSADPLFVNAAADDFSLTECTSPSINAGIDLVANQPDMNGVGPGNFNGLAPDQGAFETICTGTLSIAKRAFLTDGTPIPGGTVVPSGTPIQYLLYINNTGPARTDVTLQDVLDPSFEYQSGTIKSDDTVSACATVSCNGAEELSIFTSVDAQTAGTDAVDGDTVSYTGGDTVDAGDASQTNLQLDIPANSVYAILFLVEVR